MSAQLRRLTTICHPGDLDGPRPILAFEDPDVAKRVMALMNADGLVGYSLGQITVVSGQPQSVPFHDVKAWIDPATGNFLPQHPEPYWHTSQLWPWDVAYVGERAEASDVPIGRLICVSGYDGATVERRFEELLAAERQRINGGTGQA